MLHLRRAIAPAQGFGGELPVHGHAHLAVVFAQAVGIAILALGALSLFLVGAIALGTVVFID